MKQAQNAKSKNTNQDLKKVSNRSQAHDIITIKQGVSGNCRVKYLQG